MDRLAVSLPGVDDCGTPGPAKILVDRHAAAGVVEHDSRRVQTAHERNERVAGGGAREPILVVDAPDDDRGMIAVPLDHGSHFTRSVIEPAGTLLDPGQTALGVDQHAD